MSDLAEKTLQRVREALQGGEVAGVPEVIQVIQELSSKAFSITVKELADLISRDVAVTAKVIGAANTVGYNPWLVPVSTVSRAIQVIGFERVRNLALALLLAENADRTHSDEQKEAAALALQSGLLAQELARQSGRELNPEQAFICASLRNYGKLLMTTFLLPEYRQARRYEREMGIDAAYREVFGLTPLELGYNLLLSRNMPEEILRSLQDVPLAAIDKATREKEEFGYVALADFSVRLSEMAVDPGVTAAAFETTAQGLVNSYKEWIPRSELDVGVLLRLAEDEMKLMRRTYGIKSLSPRVLESLAHRVAGRDLPPLPVASAVPADMVPPLPEGAADTREIAKHPEAGSNTVVLEAIAEVTRRMSEGSIAFAEAVGLLVNAVHGQMRSTDTVLFLFDRRNGVFLPRLGRGPIFSRIERAETVNPRQRDVFGIALGRLEDVFVENARDPKIVRHLPAWLRRVAPDLHSFILLPMQEGGAAYGLIWSASTRPLEVPVGAETLRELRALRTHVTTIKNLRSGPGGPAAGKAAS